MHVLLCVCDDEAMLRVLQSDEEEGELGQVLSEFDQELRVTNSLAADVPQLYRSESWFSKLSKHKLSDVRYAYGHGT